MELMEWLIGGRAECLFISFFLANSTIPSFLAGAGEAKERMELVGV
jgi:hypothetical protein